MVGTSQRLEPSAGALHATGSQPKDTAMTKRGGALQDCTDVLLRWTLIKLPWSSDQQGLKPWRKRSGCAWQQAGYSARANGEAVGSFGGPDQLRLRVSGLFEQSKRI